ncbi:helix-turn-helix domain-containing protein, partial [Dietzia cinnamea]
MTRSQSMSAGMVQRARIVLLASEGRRNAEIAELAGASRPKVNLWRSRYEDKGIGGLADEKRSGRPRTIDHAEIVTATLMPPPKSLGVTHWSSRLLASRLKVSAST